MKKFLFFMTVFSVGVFLSGCNKQSNEFDASFKTNQEFLNKFEMLKKKAFLQDVVVKDGTKALTMKETTAVNIEVVLPIDEEDLKVDIPELEGVTCFNDLEGIIINYAADLVIAEEYDPSKRLITVDETELICALDPMVQESKNYLYSLGLSEEDIKEMIQEADSDETALIPFTLALIEHDNELYSQLQNLQRLSLFPVSYAIDWGHVGHCALHAIGVDAFAGLATTMVKTWSKAIIKRCFIKVAQRMIGPAGVAIAVVDFGFCLGGIEI